MRTNSERVNDVYHKQTAYLAGLQRISKVNDEKAVRLWHN